MFASALELEVKRRRAHPHVLCKRLNPERVREVVLHPPDRPRDPLCRGAGRGDLAQPQRLGAGEQALDPRNLGEKASQEFIQMPKVGRNRRPMPTKIAGNPL